MCPTPAVTSFGPEWLWADAITSESSALAIGLFVVKGLIVGQRRGQRQHMDGGCHIRVSQANQFEIASHGKNYRLGLPICTCQDPAVHTRGTVIDREIGRSTVWRPTTGASCEAVRAHLQRCQESDGVDLIGNKRPGDAIAGVNPDLVGQEGKRLMCSVAVLRAHLQLPIIRQRRNRKKDRNQQSTSAKS